jgi:hypothetical protein
VGLVSDKQIGLVGQEYDSRFMGSVDIYYALFREIPRKRWRK